MMKYFTGKILFVLMILLGAVVFLNPGSEVQSQNTDKASSDKNISLFRVSIPHSLEIPVRSIISKTFGTLRYKYGKKQSSFTVRIFTRKESDYSGDNFWNILNSSEIVFSSNIKKPKKSPGDLSVRYKKLGNFVLGVVVSKSMSELADLKSDVLKKILTGRIKDWSGLSGKLKGEIVVHVPDRRMMNKWFFIAEDIKATESRVKDIITGIGENKNIMGIIPLAGLNKAELNKVKLLSIDGYLPYDKKLKINDKYPYRAPLYLIWKKNLEKHRFIKEFLVKLDVKDAFKKFNVFKSKINLYLPWFLKEKAEEALKGNNNLLIKNLDDVFSLNQLIYKADIFVLQFKNEKYLKGKLDNYGYFGYEELGNSPVVVITSRSSAELDNLKSSALKDILSGKITDWSGVSSKLSGEIKIYGEGRFTAKHIFGLDKVIEINKKTPFDTVEKIIQEKNSIGILSLCRLTSEMHSKINILSVDGVSPYDQESFKSGKYPYDIATYCFWNDFVEEDEKLNRLLTEIKNIIFNKEELIKHNIYPAVK